MKKDVQAKHVSTREILAFLSDFKRLWPMRIGALHWDPNEQVSPLAHYIQSGLSTRVPEAVLLAKLIKLKKQGLVNGCECGCRGDWEITERGRDALSKGTTDEHRPTD